MRTTKVLRWVLGALGVGLGGGCQIIAGLGEPALDERFSCANGVKDGKETGKDCGGACDPCPSGSGCEIGPDCASKVCSGGTCLEPACADNVTNGRETDTDCGGSCAKCAAGKRCGGDADCAGGRCAGGACAASCTDGAKSGDETGLDCGGPCAPCAIGQGCAVGRDCETGVCDGGACASFHVWSKRFGSMTPMNSSSVSGIAVDGAGNPVVVGLFDGDISFGPGTQPLTGDGVFIAKMNPSGDLIQAASADCTEAVLSTGVVVDSKNNIVTAGYFFGTLTINATQHKSAGYTDIFVTKLHDNPGIAMWSKHFGGSDVDEVYDLAVDGNGDVLLSGLFRSSTITFGGSPLSGASGKGYLVKLDGSTGAHVWSKNFPASGYVAVDSAGNVVFFGSFTGTVNFGGTVLTSGGDPDLFVAKFSPSGTHLWSKRFGDAKDQRGNKIAIDVDGNILLSGEYAGTLDFGGGKLSSGENAVFLVKLDPEGNYVWGKSFDEATGKLGIVQVTAGSTGDVAMTGSLNGTVDVGGGKLSSTGDWDAFVAKLDAKGNHLWSRRFGEGQAQSGQAIAFSGANNLLVTGNLKGTIDFGGGPLVTMGYADVFLAKLLVP